MWWTGFGAGVGTSPSNRRILRLRLLILSVGEPGKQLRQLPSEESMSKKASAMVATGVRRWMDWWFPSFRFSKPLLFGVSRVVPCQLGWVSGATTMSRVEMEKMEDGVLVECSAFSVSHEASDQGGRWRPHP